MHWTFQIWILIWYVLLMTSCLFPNGNAWNGNITQWKGAYGKPTANKTQRNKNNSSKTKKFGRGIFHQSDRNELQCEDAYGYIYTYVHTHEHHQNNNNKKDPEILFAPHFQKTGHAIEMTWDEHGAQELKNIKDRNAW